MDYNEKKAELEAKFKPASAANRLELWLESNPNMAPKAKAAPKEAKKEAKKEVVKAEEE